MWNFIKKYKYPIILIIFLIFGLIYRTYNISNQPYWMDEGYTINAVISIQEKGSSILDSGEKYNCPIYCYPSAYIGEILDNSPLSFRLISIISGIIFILTIFFIVKNITKSKQISIYSSFIITFSYLEIAWSRQARWYTLLSLFTWISIFFFYKTLYAKNKNWLYFLATILFTFLSIKTHAIAYMLPIIFVSWYLIDLVFIKKKINIKYIILSITVLTSILFLILNKFNIQISYTLPYYLSFIIKTHWLLLFFAVISLYTNSSYQKLKYFLIFIFISYLIPLSFLTNIIHYRYIFHITPVIFILGAMGIYEISQKIKRVDLKRIFIIIVFSIFLFIGGGIIIPQTKYMLEGDNPKNINNRPHHAYTPQPDWNSAYKFIKDIKKDNEIIISSMPQFNKIFLKEAGYWIAYNYLGMDDRNSYIKDGREFYVGALTIESLESLKEIMDQNTGYIIFDFMGREKISEDIITHIEENSEMVFNKKENEYSEVWVYRW